MSYIDYAYPASPNPSNSTAGDKDFNILTPEDDGVGNYHVNHFIGFFAEPWFPLFHPNLEPEVNPRTGKILMATFTNQDMVRLFHDNFPKTFNPNEAASAEFFKKKENNKEELIFFDGKPVLKFTGKTFGPDIHNDYVSLTLKNDSGTPRFFGKTLKRNFEENIVNDKGPAIIEAIINQKFGSNIRLPDNKYHFLAGRRSWTVGFLEKANIWFIETAAFERYSDQFFVDFENILGLREDIKTVWVTLINNFILNYQKAPFLAPKILGTPNYQYKRKGFVSYIEAQASTAEELRNIGWVKQVFARHPDL